MKTIDKFDYFSKKTRNDKLRLCINPIKITSIDVTIHVSPILRLFAIKFLFFSDYKKGVYDETTR